MSIASTRSHGRSENRSISRWLAWTPLLMVAALLYWSVALGLGCFSLMAVTALSGSQENDPFVAASAEDTAVPAAPEADDPAPIVVHLQESVEPEDVNDNVGAGSSSVTADPAAVASPAPGETSY